MTSPWPSRQVRWDGINNSLVTFDQTVRPLPGIPNQAERDALTSQIVASLRRLEFTQAKLTRAPDARRADPADAMFDPESGAIWLANNGRLDDAVWLTFLSVHFGKHKRSGWTRLREVYGACGGKTWTWARVAANVPAFRAWLEANRGAIGGGFGNHRKYESLGGQNVGGTGAVVESYLAWVGPSASHQAHFAALIGKGGNDPARIFDEFYNSMQVARFGRLGKFDFLALLGRLKLAPIEPGSAYLVGATGPLRGVRLLFGGSTTAPIRADQLQAMLSELDAHLGVGMQVLEDSLCNWQKSPARFVHFLG